ncbi:nuclear transport factor 2 family protein [Corallococcus aberystwythensis]|nr:nuclear transport factor 2 family protein [Corallococcus aberystwythensis]
MFDRYYECINAGDGDGWLALFAERLLKEEPFPGHIEDLLTQGNQGV